MMTYDRTQLSTILIVLDRFTICLYWQSILLSIYDKVLLSTFTINSGKLVHPDYSLKPIKIW